MATNEERINTAIVQLEGDSELFHDFVHNPNPETVTTESGVIPTLSKLVTDLSAQVVGVTTEAVTAASSAAASAATSASKSTVASDRAAAAEASAANAASSASSAGGQVAAAVAAAQASATSSANSLTASQASADSAQGASASATTAITTANEAKQQAGQAVASVDAISAVTGAGKVGATLPDGTAGKVQAALDALAARSGTVDKASDLRSLRSSDERYIETAGYGKPGDGGKALYYLDAADTTSPDDGFLVFVDASGNRRKLNHNGSISVKQAGAKGIGSSFNDSPAFLLCASACMKNSLEMLVPPVAPGLFYNMPVGIVADQKLVIRGSVGGPINVYAGLPSGGSRIHYTGSGDWLGVDTSQDSGKIGVEGTTVKDLILIGTAAAKYCIRVGLASDVGSNLKVKSNIILDNLYIGDFKHGYGWQFNWCFSNTVNDVVVQNCGCAGSVFYAHGTRIKGGNLEQSLVGLDCRISYGVVLDGTVLQGMDQTRQTTFGLAVPADFTVWSGWDGTGTTGALRNTPAGYAGVAVRNLGSILGIEGCAYWEYNNYNIITETDSHTTVQGGIVGLDSITKSFVQIGLGAVIVRHVGFQGGSHADFQGVFQTERNYAAPCEMGPGCVFPTTIPRAKIFTGPQTHVGRTSAFDPQMFSIHSHDYKVFHNDGQSLAPNTAGAVGNFDLFPYAQSNKIRQVVGASTTISYSFTDTIGIKASAGASLCLHVIATGAATVLFNSANFRTGATSYTLTASSQIMFRFEFSNGFWVMAGTPQSVQL